jgi:hypothetical protein
MVRTPDDSDRDFSPGLSEDNINADIAELFSSLPPGVEEFFADPRVQRRIGMLDPRVQRRIGMLIAQAINKPARSQR